MNNESPEKAKSEPHTPVKTKNNFGPSPPLSQGLSTHPPTPASVHSPTPELAAATSNPGTAVQVEQVADKKAVEEEAKSKLLRTAREKEIADLRAAVEASKGNQTIATGAETRPQHQRGVAEEGIGGAG
ncbi:hypothetical protein DL95DRAFT_479867 [Leptodontidium sp. 2 PMI_412]|nr:hypothetical protein DL95DRAFT_479867 [Leptodontidium sp. 2 PMI_412]